MEKYPVNTPYRACFLGIEDISYKSNDNKLRIWVTCYSWAKKEDIYICEISKETTNIINSIRIL